jgi:hypothetical protein
MRVNRKIHLLILGLMWIEFLAVQTRDLATELSLLLEAFCIASDLCCRAGGACPGAAAVSRLPPQD